MSAIKIEEFQFGNNYTAYVIISIAVGERGKMPHRMVIRKMKDFRQHSNLCKVLTEQGIPCDIMPAYVNVFSDTIINNVADDLPTMEGVEELIDDAKSEAMCYTQELREELVKADVLPELDNDSLMKQFGIGVTESGAPDFTITITDDENPMRWLVHFDNSMWSPKVASDTEALNDVLDHFK